MNYRSSPNKQYAKLISITSVPFSASVARQEVSFNKLSFFPGGDHHGPTSSDRFIYLRSSTFTRQLSRWADILAQESLVGNGDNAALSLLARGRASADKVVDAGHGGGG